MNTFLQVSILVVAIAILVLICLMIPILLDLRRIIKNWKKISELLELGIAPITLAASFILDVLKILLETGEEKKDEKK